ncbi:MAG: histidinol dehydrogenase [Myxococcales bacterium]|nr:histidinol dehydrogenase [Myxococcales bacterium]
MAGPVMLRRVTLQTLPADTREAVDAATLAAAGAIVADVAARGEAALRHHAERLGDLAPGGPLVLDRAALQAAADALDPADRALLQRTVDRVRAFADAQRAAIQPIEVPIPGGVAGHQLAPVERAGCYAPGGRFPLPSSVIMTAVTARAAGVQTVWVASPRPTAVTQAAAALAGADALLCVGGAQAIAAFAYGAGPVPRMDAIVGPGNKWVTAAKQTVAGRVAIDMLAGPSELVVLADDTADPATVAADLLAQAEHDVEALPILVTPSARLADAVDVELAAQLAVLPTAATARAAVAQGYTVLVDDLDQAVEACDRIAPEHLEVDCQDADRVAARLKHWGGLFVGDAAAEVLGDYGAGPNHTLPTGGTARYSGGLSVFTFLRVRTWMRIDDRQAAAALVTDATRLARLEGLEAHARAAARRQPTDRSAR